MGWASARLFFSMFEVLKDKINKFKNLDINKIAYDIASTRTHKTLVIQLNTEGKPTSQLYEKGKDSKGKVLQGKSILKGGEYSPITRAKKAQIGQRYDHPTLKDTGNFYLSFQVVPYNGGFTINADPNKDGMNLFNELGENILGLDDENLQILIDFYKNAIQTRLQSL